MLESAGVFVPVSRLWKRKMGINSYCQKLNPRWKPSNAQFLQIQHLSGCVALSKQSSTREPLFAVNCAAIPKRDSIILLFGCSSFQLKTLLCDPFSQILGTGPTFKLRFIHLMSLNPIHVFAKWAKDLRAVNFKALPYCTYYKKCIQALVALISKAFIHS